MNCHVKDKNGFCYAVAEQKDMIEVLGMKVRVDKDVEISEVELAAGLFWEMTYLGPKEMDCYRNYVNASVVQNKVVSLLHLKYK